MKSRAVSGFALALIAAACATPSPSPTPTATPGPGAEVIVLQHFAGDGLYIEGAFAYVEVFDAGGEIVAANQTPDYHRDLEILRAQLPVGDYTLRSYVRPCSGNCGFLDPPTAECRTTFSVEPDQAVGIVVERAINGCDARLQDG